MHLYQVLAQKVDEWRKNGYPHDSFPVIAEILQWAGNPEGAGFRLRPPQARALETYWYLRLVENTPHILDLYRKYFPQKRDLIAALGISPQAFESVDYELASLWDKIKSDDAFVRQFRLEALRETINLRYPSYILALAMGASKTALIGSIYATEFALAFEYPEASFVQNALVFAPGKTIIESLREFAQEPYDRILSPSGH
jgi:type III restriction enzyme